MREIDTRRDGIKQEKGEEERKTKKMERKIDGGMARFREEGKEI